MQPYWSFREGTAIIDCNAMKGRRIIPAVLQDKALKQLHPNHMGIEEKRQLAPESIYWINMNADIKATVKYCSTCLDFQVTQQKDKTMSHEIPRRASESCRS